MIQLSSTQQAIYFDQLRYPEWPIYNIGAKVYIEGPMDEDLFIEAYRVFVQQHDVLRLVLRKTAEEIGLEELPNADVNAQVVDFSHRKAPREFAEQFIQHDFQKMYDLNGGQILHGTYLIKLTDKNYVLYSKYHHLVTDGWGTSLLFQRIVQNYNELLEFGIVKSIYPYSYADFVREDAEYLQSEKYQQDQDYWLKRFAQLPEAPFAKKQKRIRTSDRKKLLIPRSFYDQMIAFAQSERVSTFHLIIAIILTYWTKYCEHQDWVIGLPVLNRSSAKYKKTVGLFMGVAPLRMQVEGTSTLRALVQ